jgi:hypothetical protein
MKFAWISIFCLGAISCGEPTEPPSDSENDASTGPAVPDGMEVIDDMVDPNCRPRDCETGQCGPIADGCGGIVPCGDCEGDALCGIVEASQCTDPSDLATPLDEDAACEGRECGPAGDGIGGVVDCGDCEDGQSCGAGGPARCGRAERPDEDNCPAKLTSCEDLGAACGIVGNGCGGVLDCDEQVGGCDSDELCGLEEHFQCSPAPTCDPVDPETACEDKCGIVSNGCGAEVNGGIIDCSELPDHECESGTTCGGGGVPNECAQGTCEPLAPAEACGDRECGSTTDGCDGSTDCGTCAPGALCVDGFCDPLCEPIPRLQACLDKDCGQAGDGCGGTYDCGSCEAGQVCGVFEPFSCDPIASDVCVPFSEAELCDGRECGVTLDGCGTGPENEVDCGSCAATEICGVRTPFMCDAPAAPDCTAAESCAELGWECGIAIDDCANMFDCALEGLACNAQLETCIGGITGPTRCLNGTEEEGSCDVCDGIADCSGRPQRTALTGRVISPGADDNDVANQLGIPNAFVYILRSSDESLLPELPSGIPSSGGNYLTDCGRCEDEDLGPVLVSTTTDAFGAFRLEGEVPVGRDFVLVVKIGKWRRATRISALPDSAACADTPLPVSSTRLPRSMADGLRVNIPKVAVSTGQIDAMECVLEKLGVALSEFAEPGAAGEASARVHMYRSANAGGAQMSTGFTPAPRLYQDIDRLFAYDMVVFDCEGTAFESNDDDPRVREFVNRGGRLFASHWSYTWIHDNGAAEYTPQTPFITGLGPSASWGSGDELTDTTWVSIGRPRAVPAKVQNFAAWLEAEGAATVDPQGRYALQVTEPRDLATQVGVGSEEYVYRLPDSSTGVTTNCKPCDDIGVEDNCTANPTCSWTPGGVGCGPKNDCRLKDQAACTADPACAFTTGCGFAEPCTGLGSADQVECTSRAQCGWDSSSVQQFAFNTPYGAPGEAICGRVAYSGFHVVADAAGFANAVFPEHCEGNLTSQEKVLAYMLFDLGACVSPGGLEPPPCDALDESQCDGRCGPIADGCGGVVDCSDCPAGEVCLAGGVCAPPQCQPTTCDAEGAECGTIADGCGATVECDLCPEGEVCGLVTPNRCDSPCAPANESTACEGKCGYVSDECSDVFDCGECPPGLTCIDNFCVDRTCEPATSCPPRSNCGIISDGCDGTLDCGDCELPEVCGGALEPNVCGAPDCPVLDCESQGAECGVLGNGCGNTVDCGECPPGQVCGVSGPNECDGCQPLSCEEVNAECGAIGDGCGDTVDCGDCPEGEVCGATAPNRCGSGNCPKQSCEDANAECGIIGDGCGDTVDCGDCEGDKVCGIETPFVCGDPPECTPRTCEDAEAECGQLSDFCGDLLDCGECKAPSFCLADNTCSAGQR